MKLVQKTTGKVLAEEQDGKIIFHSRILEKALQGDGILIPPTLRASFNGQTVVLMDDPLFYKAFVEVYCRFDLNGFEWK